jgi:hypothetical protein
MRFARNVCTVTGRDSAFVGHRQPPGSALERSLLRNGT